MNFEIDPREINLQGPDGMQLIKLLRRLIAAIESGGDEPEPGDDSEFFYCTYGTTTYSEIQNALAEDKVPICIRNGLYYYLVNTTQNRYVFACYNPTNNYIYAVRCLTDRWDNVTFMLQERLTWDYAPTQGSTRPVTSGGVWTALQNAGGSDIDPYQQYPEMDGTASPGSSDDYARGDHVHPKDTAKVDKAQGVENAGKLLVINSSGNVVPGEMNYQQIQTAVDDWLDDHAASIDGLSFAAKQAIMDCFAHVAWADANGQQYYDALYNALFEGVTLESITAVFTQGSATIYDTDSLDTLRQYLVVTATYSDSTTATVTDYTLSGTLTAGASTITVNYGGKTDTFNVTVTRLEIKVFRGKGVSGTSIVDNAKRALSEPVAFTNVAPITIEWPSLSAFRAGFKNTAPDVNTIDTSTSPSPNIAPIAYLNQPRPSSSELVVDGWLLRSGEEFITAAHDVGETLAPITFSQSSGYVRLLFADISSLNNSLPSDSIDSVFYINGIPYHLVETPVSEFE